MPGRLDTWPADGGLWNACLPAFAVEGVEVVEAKARAEGRRGGVEVGVGEELEDEVAAAEDQPACVPEDDCESERCVEVDRCFEVA